MAIAPIYGSTSSVDPNQQIAALGGLNNSQITAMLVNGQVDPKFATMLINQMSSNNVNSILFGDSSQQETSDIFGMQGMVPSNLQGTSTMNTTDIFGASAFGGGSSQFELSVYSSLIGKTVTAKDPLTGQQVTDKVTSVMLQDGKIVLDLNGKIIPTANLLKIS